MTGSNTGLDSFTWMSQTYQWHTTTAERTRCYTDNTTAPNLPPNIINIPCIQTARYVIVETTYDAPEDDPQKGAVLEICEIQVKGCVINWKMLRFTSYKTRILNN